MTNMNVKNIRKEIANALKGIKQAGQREREGLRNSIRHSLIAERRQCKEVEARIIATLTAPKQEAL